MTVYIDDAKNKFRYMVMSHMIADKRSELDEMAEKIGLNQIHKQNAGLRQEHFDVSQDYAIRAMSRGAKRVTQRELSRILSSRDLKEYLES